MIYILNYFGENVVNCENRTDCTVTTINASKNANISLNDVASAILFFVEIETAMDRFDFHELISIVDGKLPYVSMKVIHEFLEKLV
jgi:hypothetical protein